MVFNTAPSFVGVEELKPLRTFALELIDDGESFEYNGRDLARYFP
jgi:hypothetical protein